MTECVDLQDVSSDTAPTEDINTITGEILQPQQRERVFDTLTGLCDYVKVFGITGGQFAQARVNGSNKLVYVLVYNSVN